MVQERRPAVGEIVGEGLAGRPPEQPDALLAALAQDPQLASGQLQRPEVRGGQLADPEPGGVGGLDERAIAERDRPGEVRVPACGRRRAGLRGEQVVVDHREQRLDLLDLEDLGQPAREARPGDRAPRVAGREARPGRSSGGTSAARPAAGRRTSWCGPRPAPPGRHGASCDRGRASRRRAPPASRDRPPPSPRTSGASRGTGRAPRGSAGTGGAPRGRSRDGLPGPAWLDRAVAHALARRDPDPAPRRAAGR